MYSQFKKELYYRIYNIQVQCCTVWDKPFIEVASTCVQLRDVHIVYSNICDAATMLTSFVPQLTRLEWRTLGELWGELSHDYCTGWGHNALSLEALPPGPTATVNMLGHTQAAKHLQQ